MIFKVEWFTLKEAAIMLGVSLNELEEIIGAGKLLPKMYGGELRVNNYQIEKYLNENK